MYPTKEKVFFKNNFLLNFKNKRLEKKYKQQTYMIKKFIFFFLISFFIIIFNFMFPYKESKFSSSRLLNLGEINNFFDKEKVKNIIQNSNEIYYMNLDARILIDNTNKSVVYGIIPRIEFNSNVNGIKFFFFILYSLIASLFIILIIIKKLILIKKNDKNKIKENTTNSNLNINPLKKDSEMNIIKEQNKENILRKESTSENYNNKKKKQIINNTIKIMEKFYNSFDQNRYKVFYLISYLIALNNFLQFQILNSQIEYYLNSNESYDSYKVHFKITIPFSSFILMVTYLIFYDSNFLLNFLSFFSSCFIQIYFSLGGNWGENYKIFILLFILVAFSYLTYALEKKKRKTFGYLYDLKIDLKKNMNILENCNSGFLTFGENCNFNYNKKFFKIANFIKNKILLNYNKTQRIFLEESNQKKNYLLKLILENSILKNSLYHSDTNIRSVCNLINSKKLNKQNNNHHIVIKNKSEVNLNDLVKDFSDIFLFLLFFENKNTLLCAELDKEIVEFINNNLIIHEIENNLNSKNHRGQNKKLSLNSKFEIDENTKIINLLNNQNKDANKKQTSNNSKWNGLNTNVKLTCSNEPYQGPNYLKNLGLKTNSNLNFINPSEFEQKEFNNIGNNNFCNNFINNSFNANNSNSLLNINNFNLNFYNFSEKPWFISKNSKHSNNNVIKEACFDPEKIHTCCFIDEKKEIRKFLSERKETLKQFFDLIKKKFKNDDFIPLFNYKNKIKNSENNDELNIMVHIRYNKLSDKIEFLMNDLTQIIKSESINVEKKTKKKFLRKFSHEFRNPILNIIQLIKNSKNFEQNEIKSILIKKALNSNPNQIAVNSALYKSNALSNIINDSIIFKENIHEGGNTKIYKLNSCKNFNCSNNDKLEEREIYNFKSGDYINLKNPDLNSPNESLSPVNYLTNTNNQNNIDSSHNAKTSTFRNLVPDKTNSKSQTSNTANEKALHQKNSNNYENINFKRNNKINKIDEMTILENNNNNNIYIDSNNLRIYENLNKFTISNFDHMKYLCYYMNFLINDFDFIVKQDPNQERKSAFGSNLTNIYTKNSKKSFENLKNNFPTNIQHSLNSIIAIDPSQMYFDEMKKETNMISRKDTIFIKSIFTRIDIHKTVSKIIKIFRSKIILAEKKIDLIMNIEKSVPKIIITSLEKINQILFNLLSNSFKFTKFGKIILSMNCPEKNHLEFEIFDTGIGINNEHLKNIFEPYFKLKDKSNNLYGIGLGLYLVKIYVSELGGSFLIESEENKNTKIKFFINFDEPANDHFENLKNIEEKEENLFSESSQTSKDENEILEENKNNNSIKDVNLNSKDDSNISSIVNFSQSSLNINNKTPNDSEHKILLDSELDKSDFPQEKTLTDSSENANNFVEKAKILNEFIKDKKKKNIIDDVIHFDKFSSDVDKKQLNIKTDSNKNFKQKLLSNNKYRRMSHMIVNYKITKKKNKKNKEENLEIEEHLEEEILQERKRQKVNKSFSIHNKNPIAKSTFFKNPKASTVGTGILLTNSKVVKKLNSNNENNLIDKEKELYEIDDYNNKDRYKKTNPYISNCVDKNNLIVHIIDNNSDLSEFKINSPANKNSAKLLNFLKTKTFNKKNNIDEIQNSIVCKNKIKRSFSYNDCKTDSKIKKIRLNNNYSSNSSSEELSTKRHNLEEIFLFDYQKIHENFNINEFLISNSYIYSGRGSSKKQRSNSILLNESNFSLNSVERSNQNFYSDNAKSSNQLILKRNPTKAKSSNKILKLNSEQINSKNKGPDIDKEAILLPTPPINNFNSLNNTLIIKNSLNINSTIITTKIIRFLIVDDEKLIRQSNSNIIRKYFKNKRVSVDLIECEDGFECLEAIYKLKKNGITFDYIITDQTMNYITGTVLCQILRILIDNNIIEPIKIYLLTSYSTDNFVNNNYKFAKIFSKPLIMEHLEYIFKNQEL